MTHNMLREGSASVAIAVLMTNELRTIKYSIFTVSANDTQKIFGHATPYRMIYVPLPHIRCEVFDKTFAQAVL